MNTEPIGTMRPRSEDGERHYRELFAHTTDGVFVIDVVGARFRIVELNPAEERLIGISNAQAAGRFVDEALAPQIAASLTANYDRCVETMQPLTYEETVALPAGKSSTFVTTLVPVLDGAGRVRRIIGVAHDTTAAMAANAALRASERRFRQLAETIREVFWIMDLGSAEMVYVSSAYEAIWGRTCESLRQAPATWLDAVHPDDRLRVAAAFVQRHASHEPMELTYRIRRPDNTDRWIRDRSFPIFDAHGALAQIVGLAEDMTSLVKTEESLRQAQKLEVVGQLAGGVAHDFNNMLSIILSYAAFLLERLSPDDPLRVEVEEIQHAGERSAELTLQLLGFSRQQLRRPRVMSLEPVIQTTGRMLKRLLGENVRLVLRTPVEVGNIESDPGQIDQLILNLAVNARDAMPAGGDLSIETANVDVTGYHPSVPPGSYVTLTVRDTGQGMNAATLARIFEPFFTTKEIGRGTGLGLAVAFGIVKQNDAHIFVESEEGKGSSFRVYFPRTDRALEPTSSAPPQETVGGHARVLLVEDDDRVRAMMAMILRGRGYEVVERQTGAEALLLCEHDPETFDLLISDVVLARIGGIEMACRLNLTRPQMKVLLVSGYTVNVNALNEAMASGCGFLAKPITPTRLLDKVRSVLDAPLKIRAACP
jgi:two-component system cell cycle sensor histidine kinase/response regulator CckA